MEALSYGIPIIASDIPANLEVGLDRRYYFRMGAIVELVGKFKSLPELAWSRSHRKHPPMPANQAKLAIRRRVHGQFYTAKQQSRAAARSHSGRCWADLKPNEQIGTPDGISFLLNRQN